MVLEIYVSLCMKRLLWHSQCPFTGATARIHQENIECLGGAKHKEPTSYFSGRALTPKQISSSTSTHPHLACDNSTKTSHHIDLIKMSTLVQDPLEADNSAKPRHLLQLIWTYAAAQVAQGNTSALIIPSHLKSVVSQADLDNLKNRYR